ncbi:MAG: zonular occludens toxin domain-containing protein [Gammaproteobacteria bacterium]
MLIFNEGLPGSGKSYDSMVTHILPALKKGRHVYARLNGLDEPARCEKIAAYLDLPLDRVNELLHYVPEDQVRELYKLTVADVLVVVDEAHDFFVSSREKLDPSQEKMFAMHRHLGWDILLMSQYYKRLHASVRGRVQRKAVFRKMDMVGLESKYTVKHYVAIEPEKYEAVGTETKTYDKAIFPLYKSVQDGTQNLQVYEAGKFTIWHKLRPYALIMIPLGIFAVWYLAGFFTGHHSLVASTNQSNTPGLKADTNAKAAVDQKRKGFDTSVMPAEAAYIFDLANRARPRLAMTWVPKDDPQKYGGVVEFWEGQDHVLERITFAQLRALGLEVVMTNYGARIGYRESAVIATAWPMDQPGRISDERNREIDSRPIATPERLRIDGVPSAASLAADAKGAGSTEDGAALQRPHGTGAFRR